jgi:hypothetical protein
LIARTTAEVVETNMPSTSPRPVIAFLHTAAVHIETFNALGREIAPELALSHAVREDLLSAAEKAGSSPPRSTSRRRRR